MNEERNEFQAVVPQHDEVTIGRASVKTHADVLQVLETLGLPLHEKSELRWSLNTYAKALGLSPHDIAADPVTMRDQLRDFSAAMLGLSPGAYSNMLSLLRRALRLTAIPCRARRRNDPLTKKWAASYAKLTRPQKAELGSAISFFDAKGWAPEEITDAHFERYSAMLEAESLNAKWRSQVQKAIKRWNQAVDEVPGWPQMRLISPFAKRVGHCLPWDQLPPAYVDSSTKLLEVVPVV